MRIVLVRDLTGCDYFGYIPEFSEAQREHVETFEVDEADGDLLDEDFVSPVDEICQALIDVGDVEYLNADQCKLLLDWLKRRLQRPVDSRLRVIYNQLVQFATEAINLDTGIIFDL